jgi:hypothetical protein
MDPVFLMGTNDDARAILNPVWNLPMGVVKSPSFSYISKARKAMQEKSPDNDQHRGTMTPQRQQNTIF